MSQRVGVLALQGDFREHVEMLRGLDAEAVEVRLAEHIQGLDGLIIPGGESTTIARLADLYGLRKAIVDAARDGMAVWGTCAGMILMATRLAAPNPEPFGLLDITVSRNAYGRQIDSFEADIQVSELPEGRFRGVFIRAPAIESMGPGVQTLATLEDGTPVAAYQGKRWASAFHPELSGDSRLHALFLTATAGS